ncbi:hypothetical protein ACIPXV_21160 [Streptomyces libani]|uniref:hypothetical protein n=1 Tax=Streptomyces nigrescens TaxID=1920 RepID=UPI00382B5F12
MRERVPAYAALDDSRLHDVRAVAAWAPSRPASGPYADALQAYLDRTVAQFLGSAQTSAEASEAVLEALTGDRPAFRLQTSDWAREFTGTKLTDLDGSAVLGLTRGWVG